MHNEMKISEFVKEQAAQEVEPLNSSRAVCVFKVLDTHSQSDFPSASPFLGISK